MKIFEKLNNLIMKNILFVLVVLILLYLFLGFDNTKLEPIYQGGMARTMAVDDSAPMVMNNRMYKTAGVVSDTSDAKIIKNYNLSIEVKNIDNIKNIVNEKIAETNSLVDNFYSYTYSNNDLAYNYSLRIPTKQVEAVISYFKTLGIVKSENTSANDATERYSDNKNRLTNLYARRDRLRKMMESKTEKLADVIAVDRELSNVQTEIENLENANKKIDTNVSYSRLDLSILPELKFEDFNNPQWRVETSWKKAVNDLIIFGQKSVDFSFKVVVFLPFIIVAILIVLAIKKIYKNNNK